MVRQLIQDQILLEDNLHHEAWSLANQAANIRTERLTLGDTWQIRDSWFRWPPHLAPDPLKSLLASRQMKGTNVWVHPFPFSPRFLLQTTAGISQSRIIYILTELCMGSRWNYVSIFSTWERETFWNAPFIFNFRTEGDFSDEFRIDVAGSSTEGHFMEAMFPGLLTKLSDPLQEALMDQRAPLPGLVASRWWPPHMDEPSGFEFGPLIVLMFHHSREHAWRWLNSNLTEKCSRLGWWKTHIVQARTENTQIAGFRTFLALHYRPTIMESHGGPGPPFDTALVAATLHLLVTLYQDPLEALKSSMGSRNFKGHGIINLPRSARQIWADFMGMAYEGNQAAGRVFAAATSSIIPGTPP